MNLDAVVDELISVVNKIAEEVDGIHINDLTRAEYNIVRILKHHGKASINKNNEVKAMLRVYC